MLACPPCPAPPRNPFSLARLRQRLLALDGALMDAAEPGPLLARAAALGRSGDPDPRHGRRLAALAGALARELGLPASFAAELASAAELHDLGKVVLPRSLLVKSGPLSATERQQLAMHTCVATWLFGEARHPVLRLAATVARSHHERWDGGGYPDGTAGDRSPLPARIVAAADVWDALTHDRPYRTALTNGEAAALVRQMRGTALDPAVVDALLPLVL
ncbi:MAG TPA: HD domain-containing phosphohydrolase [Longimicrobiaceae bacterium]|jgi:putative two-component system response regulator|nr:HD domain-containing phosphohydrolase [Longimicrobiaceae bacterium]